MKRFPTDEQEFAWAVGLFEGEGSAGVYGNGTKSSAVGQLAMRMIDKDTVDRFHQAVGCGRVSASSFASMDKPMYRWVVTRQQDLLDLLLRMYPYLSQRRQAQVNPVIEFCKLRLSTPSHVRRSWQTRDNNERLGAL